MRRRLEQGRALNLPFDNTFPHDFDGPVVVSFGEHVGWSCVGLSIQAEWSDGTASGVRELPLRRRRPHSHPTAHRPHRHHPCTHCPPLGCAGACYFPQRPLVTLVQARAFHSFLCLACADSAFRRVLVLRSLTALVHSHQPNQHTRCSTAPCTRAFCPRPHLLLDPLQPSPNTVLLYHSLILLGLLCHHTVHLDTLLHTNISRHTTHSLEMGCPPPGVTFLRTRVHLSC